MSDYLTAEQIGVLLRPIRPGRVRLLDGMSHLEAYDVRAHLTRVFGFARWSEDLVDLVLLYDEPTETKAGKPAYTVAYRATVRLTINAPDGTHLATYTEAATGGNVMPAFKRADGHDFAIKTAVSQALKRCVTNLGDQFGLSLYRAGSKDPLVLTTLVGGQDGAADEGVDDDAPDVTAEADPTQPPDYRAMAAATADPDELRSIWLAAVEAGHMDDDLAHDLKARADEIEHTNEQAVDEQAVQEALASWDIEEGINDPS